MIWVIAGTGDARAVVADLLGAGHRVIATTATAYGGELIEDHEGLERAVGRLDTDGMISLVRERGVRLVVDASHPHAIEVSHNAMAAAARTGIPYLRYERPAVPADGVRMVDDYAEAAALLAATRGPVLLAVGSRNLAAFAALESGRCWARVLPVAASLEACARAGIGPDRIVAIRGPFSRTFNRALCAELGIRWLVTKESGEGSGTAEKIEAAQDLGIGVIMVARPEMDYPESTDDIGALVRRAGELLHG